MKKATVDDLELGNLCFGNSRGNFLIPRDEFQDPFYKEFLDIIKLDPYDRCSTDVFEMRPYYWGDDEEILKLPNFVYKPENITISWYKYPMRDSYCNQDITLEKFREILKACVESYFKEKGNKEMHS